ncbi:hypothetical protein GCM10010174_55090 [Kutzneria viridogrisea]
MRDYLPRPTGLAGTEGVPGFSGWAGWHWIGFAGTLGAPTGTGLVGCSWIGFAGTEGVPGSSGLAGWQIGVAGSPPAGASVVLANAEPPVPSKTARPATTKALRCRNKDMGDSLRLEVDRAPADRDAFHPAEPVLSPASGDFHMVAICSRVDDAVRANIG